MCSYISFLTIYVFFNIYRNCALCIGTGQVRILLFRECEWRGRKLLFDSLSLEKRWSNSKTATLNIKENTGTPKADSINYGNDRALEVSDNYKKKNERELKRTKLYNAKILLQRL